MPSDPSFLLISDRQVTSVAIDECGEPLVDLRTSCSFLSFCPTRRAENRFHSWARLAVAARLEQASDRLPRGYSLLVEEAYRTVGRQRELFEAACDDARLYDPSLDGEGLVAEALLYVADPRSTAPPHTTGGAVDVTMLLDGERLDLGPSSDTLPWRCNYATNTSSSSVSCRTRANRAILIQAMTSAGFANYPAEWWHWSFGDQYWAISFGERSARYGSAPAPEPQWSPEQRMETEGSLRP